MSARGHRQGRAGQLYIGRARQVLGAHMRDDEIFLDVQKPVRRDAAHFRELKGRRRHRGVREEGRESSIT